MFKKLRERETGRRVLNLETDQPGMFDAYVSLGLTRLLAEPVVKHPTEPIMLAVITHAANDRLHRELWTESTSSLTECPSCGGTGRRQARFTPCHACHGTGQVSS